MQHWWQDKVLYQIYPRSYKDTNGDGIGDIPGIIEKLDYLEELGIGGIWLSPIFKSPQADNGYDVANYEDIEPMFGTLDDLDELIAEADKRGIKIILDLVLNHTSDEHYWFQEALKGPDNPYYDYYIWRDGEPDVLPNDMGSTFSGPAWTYHEEMGQWYFHQYHKKQPDLNWDNQDMRQDIYAMINRWIDKGVGGFRLDVIDHLAKDVDQGQLIRYPEIHDIIKELSENCFQGKDVLTVGEAWSATLDESKLWSNPDGSELAMVFQFEHIGLDQVEGKEKWDLFPLDFMKLKEVLSRWQVGLHNKGWNSLFFENHDVPRIISRWGNDGEHRVQSAKMFGTLIHGMQGTPYIYQGQEIGMTNAHWDDISKYRDVESLNMHADRLSRGFTEESIMESLMAKSRDNARTPMQWDASENAGFTDGEAWIDVNNNYTEINVASQADDEDSILSHYKALVQLRKDYPVIVDGTFELLLTDDEEVFAYRRELDGAELVVVCNFYENELERDLAEIVDGMEVLLASYSTVDETNTLRPYESRIYFKQG